jgi:branched-chain amino acid transport system substrate-binding protein
MAAAFAVGLAAPHAQAADPIKVGVILPFSGANALSGNEVLSGIMLAIDEANAAGGINGRPIEVIKADDGGVPTTGVSAVQKLIERDKVVAILGSQTSGVTLPAGEVARKAHVPMIAAGATATDLTESNKPGDPWLFRHIPGSAQQGPESADDAVRRLNCKKIGILYENTAYGRSLAETFGKAAKASGAQVVADEHYEQGDQDFYTVLTRMREAEAGCVYLAGLIAEGAAILRQASEVQFKAQFIGSGGMVTDSVIELAGPAASEGFAVSVMYEPNTNNPIGKAFGERFQKKYNLPGNTLSGVGYDAAQILVDALKHAKSLDGTSVRDAILHSNAELVEGPPGSRAKFDEKGASYFKLGLAVVKNGKRQLLPYE